MKKIFFILIILIISTNVFSVDFNAEIFGSFNLLDYYEDELGMGGGERGRIRFEAGIEKDKLGGWARLNISSLQGSPIGIYGNVFYKPFDYLSFYITRNPDGHFGLSGYALRNFYQAAGDVIGISYDSSYTGSFLFNFDDEDIYGIAGFNNSFYSGFTEGVFIAFNHEKLKNLTINWGFPVFENLSSEEMLKYMTLQVAYELENIGLFGLTYSGKTNMKINEEKPARPEEGENLYISSDPWSKSPVFRAYFGTEISGFKLDFGIGYMLPVKAGDDKRNYPVSIGAAAAFDINKVSFKARMLITGFGSYQYQGNTYKSPFDFRFDILPSMPLTEKITGYLNISFLFHNPETQDSKIGFSIFPYITIGTNDFCSFYTGLEIAYLENFYFRVPFGISISF